MAETFRQDPGSGQCSQVGDSKLRKKRKDRGESGGGLAQKCDAHVVHVAPLVMLSDGLRDVGRQLIFREYAEHLRLSEIWIRERGFDDQRLTVCQECAGDTRGRASSQRDFLAERKLRRFCDDLT